MSPERTERDRGPLVRAGFMDVPRAERSLTDIGSWADEASASLIPALSATADPDLALLGLVRLHEVLEENELRELATVFADSDAAGCERLVTLFGASAALTDHVIKHPDQWRDVVTAQLRSRAAMDEALQGEVGDQSGATAYDALRVAYRRQLVQIAAIDITSDSVEQLPQITEALADLAGAALQAALKIAERETTDAQIVRLSIIGMGKCGGRELNYISDVDVVFVAEPASADVAEAEALAVGTKLASAVMRICGSSTAEGSLWEVDAALRPEGKQGPLVRTVASHRTYYERWAKTWEFQALLKARPVAGDAELGQQYLDAVQPMVWQASTRENFVEDVQAMRRRVEQLLPSAQQKRQLKLGPGGLRDIEFSVQLLQLVHGRTDEHLHNRNTLAAIESLSRGGYVGRVDAHRLDQAYRQLRVLEHRIQMSRMRRTHLMPTNDHELRCLARSLGFRKEPAEELLKQWREVAIEVRRLHERLFYRPLLSAVAQLSDGDARLSTQSAADRLAALGYRDPEGAIRHLEALTAGISRRAAIQRTLLPVMLQWFAAEVDPDLGLLAFRKISESLGASHWYLKMLRDEGSAAETLARVLASSRYVGQLLERAPSAVSILGDPEQLLPRTCDQVLTSMRAAIGRQDDDDAAILAVRSARRTELIRIAVADLSGAIDLSAVEDAMTALNAATLQAALDLGIRQVERTHGAALSTRITIIGMGRLGGGESGYSSDADVMFVHDPRPDADAQLAQAQAVAVVSFVRTQLASSGPDPALQVDADLRPEGKSGPIVRSLESYAAYYARWSEGWEAQALLRAYPIAGDAELGQRFVELIDPLRYPEGGLAAASVRQIRMLKARMEAERIPRGGDVRSHFKLGRGGLSDVEWTVQLAQLEHAHEHPKLRRTGTTSTLGVMAELGLLTKLEAAQLYESWTLATRLRNASVLWRGRPVDSLPSDRTDALAIARIVHAASGDDFDLSAHYLRVARKARAVVEERFYGTAADPSRDHEPTR